MPSSSSVSPPLSLVPILEGLDSVDEAMEALEPLFASCKAEITACGVGDGATASLADMVGLGRSRGVVVDPELGTFTDISRNASSI